MEFVGQKPSSLPSFYFFHFSNFNLSICCHITVLQFRNLHVANLPNQMMIYQSVQKKVLQVGLLLKCFYYQLFSLSSVHSILFILYDILLNIFILICHTVKPRKGDALLFYSLLPSAIPDPQSLHAGCPVIEGEKWSATKWIHVDSFDKIVGAGGNCTDQNDNCERWAALGECKNNPEYMIGTAELPGACRRSCKLC